MTTSLKILLTELILVIFFGLLARGSGKTGYSATFGFMIIIFVITAIVKIWL